MNEKNLMALCLEKIEETINWKSRDEWTDSDFKVLSQKISEQTEITISAHTLKRLFGKIKYKETYNPQNATKDALARFIGYNDWLSFSKSHNQKKKSNKTSFVVSFSVTIITVFLVFYYWKSNKTEKTVSPPEITITPDKTVGKVPLTVSFNYGFDPDLSDSIIIDFGYMHHFQGYQKTNLPPEQTNINHCFQAPGFYNVKVLYGSELVKTIKIHALSNEWIGKIINGDQEKMVRIKNDISSNEDIIKYGQNNIILDKEEDGWLYISPQTINDAGFANNQVYYLTFENYFNTSLSADNFTYKTRFKNSKKYGGITCFDSRLAIVTENGPASINFAEVGCYRYTSLNFSDYNLNGEFDNLNFLSCDLEQWNILEIINKEKDVSIFLNEKLIHEFNYSTPLGNIKGLRYYFKGSGMVDWVILENNFDEIIFKDDF